jgi:hypothetical protein
VAFIDILGFKEIVRKSETDNILLHSILDAMLFLKKFELPKAWELTTIEIEETAQKTGIDKFNIEKQVQCTCFSDSVVVSVLCDDNSVNESVSTLIANLSLLGANLITQGILIRGGITFGNLIHRSDGVVVGQGLIDSYQIESKLARYPRIILSKKIIEKINYPILKKCDAYPYHQYVKRYEDGCVGFCQLRCFQVLQSWNRIDKLKLKRILKKAKDVIINGLNTSFEEPDLYEKYVWLKNEYNALAILDTGIKEEIKTIFENTIHYPK